jgi:hypothetical protein
VNRPIVLALIVAASHILFANSASAERYVKAVNGKEVVIHTSAIPVVLHRIVPPYAGKHFTERQLRDGRLPRGARR